MTCTVAVPRTSEAGAGPASAPTVRTVDICKTIEDHPILSSVSFEAHAGTVVALLGANGAGKSTLLRILATLTPPSSGLMELFGQPVRRDPAALRGHIGMIGHQLMLYRDLSARENLELFGRLYGVRDARARAASLIESVGLTHRAEDAVRRLSRGMAQRVAIARALMHEPALLLADEPFTGLDAPSVRLLEQRLLTLRHEGMTIILTNHDIAQSLRLADEVIVLRRGRVVLREGARGLDVETVLAATGEAS